MAERRNIPVTPRGEQTDTAHAAQTDSEFTPPVQKDDRDKPDEHTAAVPTPMQQDVFADIKQHIEGIHQSAMHMENSPELAELLQKVQWVSVHLDMLKVAEDQRKDEALQRRLMEEEQSEGITVEKMKDDLQSKEEQEKL